MTKALDIAKQVLLSPTGIVQQDLEKVLGQLLGRAVDSADLYFQATRTESWSLDEGIVKEAAYSSDRGVGVRAMAGDKTGFAYSDDIILPALEQAAGAARTIAHQGQSGILQAWQAPRGLNLYNAIDPLPSLGNTDKVKLLSDLDAYVRSKDPRVKEVVLTLAGSYTIVLIVGSDGTWAADVRPLVRLGVHVIAQQGTRREAGFSGGGGRVDYHYFTEQNRAMHFADEAVRQALVNLEAIDAPAGTMPVVLGPGWPGVLLHEAIGHGLEGDFNRKGSSAFSGRIGERVATPLCTLWMMVP